MCDQGRQAFVENDFSAIYKLKCVGSDFVHTPEDIKVILNGINGCHSSEFCTEDNLITPSDLRMDKIK